MKTNYEAEQFNTSKKAWVLAYAYGSEYYIPEALHVERNDELWLVEDDYEAARCAEKDGVVLIHDIDGVDNGVYIDTDENRNIIFNYINSKK